MSRIKMPRFTVRVLQRIKRFNWRLDADEPWVWHAIGLASKWMSREYQHKGKIKGGLLRKGCGIAVEEIFDSILNELEIAHSRTNPLLDKSHPANKGKKYDFKLADGTTIDVKSIPPYQDSDNLRLNVDEATPPEGYTCDCYIAFKFVGEFSQAEKIKMQKLDEKSQTRDFAEADFKELYSFFKRANLLTFVGWLYGKEIVSGTQKKGRYGSYYTAYPRRNAEDFAKLILHRTVDESL